jgi:hypothetical protein
MTFFYTIEIYSVVCSNSRTHVQKNKYYFCIKKTSETSMSLFRIIFSFHQKS